MTDQPSQRPRKRYALPISFVLATAAIALAADPEVVKGKLPPDWPKDVAVHADAKPETYTDDGDRIVLTLSVVTTPEKITDYYKAQMVKDGWKQTSLIGNLIEFTKAGRTAGLHSFKGDNDEKATLVIDYRKK